MKVQGKGSFTAPRSLTLVAESDEDRAALAAFLSHVAKGNKVAPALLRAAGTGDVLADLDRVFGSAFGRPKS